MKRTKNFGPHETRGGGRRRAEKEQQDPAPGFSEKVREAHIPKFHMPDKKHVMLFCAALAAVLLIVLSAVSINSDKSDYKYYMKQAAGHYGSGDYDSALSFLRKASALEQRDECLILMADCYEAQGNIGKAIEALQKLKSNERSILRRIASLEQKRAELMAKEKICIGGVGLDPDEESLNLDGIKPSGEELGLLTGFGNLNKLSLRDNGLEDISPLSGLTKLVCLDLSGNSVKDISALTKLRGLRTLSLDYNPVEDLSPLQELKNLKKLCIRGIEMNEGKLRELSESLPGCAIFSGENPEAPALICMGGVSFSSDITVLDLSGMELTDISALSFCHNLVRLNLMNNSISDLSPIMNTPDLEWLNISDNLVADLRPLMGIDSLETIIADNNRISSTAAVGSMSGLRELRLSGNPVGDYSGLAKLTDLLRLSLKNTGLTDDDLVYLEKLPSLCFVEIDDNPELSGEAVEMLQISLGTCLINHSPLMYSIKIGGKSINGHSRDVNLSRCSLEDISELSKLSFMESLDLSSNSISNIYIFQYTDSRKTLKYLDLSSNHISDITPIASLQNLESLDLTDNKVNSITQLLSLKNLRMLKLGGNQLTEEQIQTLRDNLPGCEIVCS